MLWNIQEEHTNHVTGAFNPVLIFLDLFAAR